MERWEQLMEDWRNEASLVEAGFAKMWVLFTPSPFYPFQVQASGWWPQQCLSLSNIIGVECHHQGLEDKSIHLYPCCGRGECTTRPALIFSLSDAPIQLDFRQSLLAKELMDFLFVVNAGKKKRLRWSMKPVASVCGVETAPVYAGSWTGTQWQFLTSKYPQKICKTAGCKKQIRTCCKCMIGFWVCPACIGMHIAEIAEALWVNFFLDSSILNNFLAIRASQLLPIASL